MKKLLFIALLLISTPALAENPPPAGGPPAAAQDGGGPSPDKRERLTPEQREQKFAEHKARILEHISQRIAEAQKNQACVQAAQDHDALRACRPEKGKGRGFRHRGHEGGDHDERGNNATPN